MHRDPFTIDAILQVPAFVATGIGIAFGSVTGVGPIVGLLVGLAVVGVAVIRLVRGHPVPPRFIAAMSGILIYYTLVALTRAGVTPEQVQYTRYTYTTGVLAIIAIAALLGPEIHRLSAAPGRGRLLVVTAGGMTLALALLWNGRLLLGGRDLFLERAQVTRALITVAIDPDRPHASTSADRWSLCPPRGRLIRSLHPGDPRSRTPSSRGPWSRSGQMSWPMLVED